MTHPGRSILRILAAVTLFACANLALAQTEAPLITFDQEHPLVNTRSDTPMVSIYADGTAVIFRAPVYRNPGEYRFQLSDQELEDILSLAGQPGVLSFSTSELTQTLEEGVDLLHISLPTTSVFTFNGNIGNPSTGLSANSAESLSLSISVEDVGPTAERAPEFPGINSLNALQQKLITLFTEAGE